MKIVTKTTWSKRVIGRVIDGTLYLSVPFTWLMGDARRIAAEHRGRVVAGGPAVSLVGAPWADEAGGTPPIDFLRLHNPDATFTTRGCARACAYCAVPRIEGRFRELKEWRPAPVVCDNNITLASKSHFIRVVESLVDQPWVDFNQGMDARLFKSWHADELARLKKVRVRFALDSAGIESNVADAVALARSKGLGWLGVYVLVGKDEDPDEAVRRLELIRSWGIRPNPMRFQPLDATRRNAYVPPQWDERRLKHVVRYYSCLAYVGNRTLDEFIDYEEGQSRRAWVRRTLHIRPNSFTRMVRRSR